MDRSDSTYETYKPAGSLYDVALPLALLVIVVAVVGGLVLGGVLQGHAERVGASGAPSTEPTVLIIP